MGAVSRVYLRVTRMVPSYRQAFIFRLGVSGYDHGTGTTTTLWRRVNDKHPSAPRQIGQAVRYLGVMQSDSCIAARYQDFSAAISPNPAAVRLIRHTAGRYLSIHCNREMNPAGVRPINHTPRRYPSQSCRRTTQPGRHATGGSHRGQIPADTGTPTGLRTPGTLAPLPFRIRLQPALPNPALPCHRRFRFFATYLIFHTRHLLWVYASVVLLLHANPDTSNVASIATPESQQRPDRYHCAIPLTAILTGWLAPRPSRQSGSPSYDAYGRFLRWNASSYETCQGSFPDRRFVGRLQTPAKPRIAAATPS